MKKKYYKVCGETIDGALCSAVVWGAAEVEYVPGEWVKAPGWLRRRGYHITVFDSLSAAREFAEICRDPHVFECDVRGVIKKLPPILDGIRLSEGKIKCADYYEWQLHTIMARRVKLLQEV